MAHRNDVMHHFTSGYRTDSHGFDASHMRRALSKHFGVALGKDPNASDHSYLKSQNMPITKHGHKNKLDYKAEWHDHIKAIPEQLQKSKDAFDKAHPKGATVYRGASEKEVSGLKEGSIYHTGLLTSTSLEHGTGIHYAQHGNKGIAHVIEFRGVKGRHTFTGVHDNPKDYKATDEVLLHGNSKWKVHSIKEEKREMIHNVTGKKTIAHIKRYVVKPDGESSGT
jgi:hypothetical protein